MKRLLEVAELRILASERGIGAVETEGDRLRLSRQGDYLTLGGKFPRLTKPDPAGKLREIRRLLLAL